MKIRDYIQIHPILSSNPSVPILIGTRPLLIKGTVGAIELLATSPFHKGRYLQDRGLEITIKILLKQ